MYIWKTRFLTCMPSAIVLRMHAKRLTKCLNEMWFHGLLSFQDTFSMGMLRRLRSCFTDCNGQGSGPTSTLWGTFIVRALVEDAFQKGNMIHVCAIRSDKMIPGHAIRIGMMFYGYAIRTGFESNVIVGNVLIIMYVKSMEMEDGSQVFEKMPERDVVSWNSLIAGYAQIGYVEDALKLVHEMQCAGVMPDQFTFVSLLGVCQSTHALQNGYVQQCFYGEAIDLFRKMLQATVKPNQVTFSSILGAFSSLAALEHGKQVHAHIIRNVTEFTTFVRNSLITLYAECGNIGDGRKIFEKMAERGLVTWNAMIGGYAQHGCGKEVLKLFETMRREGIEPDPVTFVGVLSACSHEGLVDEGQCYFEMMTRDYGIFPDVGHYACMVDILGRAARFNEAESLIKNMPFEPDAGVWGALMGACRIHGNLELGKLAAEWLYVLEPENTAAHVLLSHIYATAGKWDDAARVRRSMRNRGLQKKPGCSWIEIRNRIYAFVLEDR